MSTNRQERIARNQRTTLRNGTKLIDALRAGPKTSFTTPSRLAPSGTWRSLIARAGTPKNWENAFAIGQPGGSTGKLIIGQMFKMMYENALDLQDEANWIPVKPLGNGSFGAAALFKHEDGFGGTDDYVVVKYTQSSKKEMVSGWNSDISKEAAIMMQLNEVNNNDGILFLREFRYFEDTNRHAYFTEYCPHFDVETLRLTHRAMKRHIPEALLFYIFYALAKGLWAMEDGPFGDYSTPHKHIPYAFIVHRDIKPPNTFLGYTPAPSQPFSEADPDYLGFQLKYPHAKIADFGLSEITNYSSDVNMMCNHRAGTPIWFPPEVRTKRFNPNSTWYPFRGVCFDSKGNAIPPGKPVMDKVSHAYTPAGNTFVVGFMMYQLITLDEPEDMSNYVDRIVAEQELPVPKNLLDTSNLRQRFAQFDAIERTLNMGYGITDVKEKLRRELHGTRRMLLGWHTSSYSPELKGLVEKCMAFLPEERIWNTTLVNELEAILPRYRQELQQLMKDTPAEYEKTTRAFTSEADLPDMLPGTAIVDLDALFWRRLVRAYKWLDLTAGNIKPPIDPNDTTIPQEAHDMFAKGRKQNNNNIPNTIVTI